MSENQSMDINIKAKVENAHRALEQVIKDLNLVGKKIQTVQTQIDKTGKTTATATIINGLTKINLKVSETGEKLKYVETTAQGTKKSLSNMFDVGKLYVFWNLAKRLRTTISGWVTSAIDFQETVNLFNVSMGSAYKEATKFQNKLSEAFGTARTEMMQYQSAFKNILGGLGELTTQTSEKISETLTSMALDYSSLYNVSQASAMNKFQSALTGSIMPIRKESGYDVSKNAVSAKLTDLGVEKTYSQLTETEKRLVRIILLMQQMKNTGAFQDLARTIESPSNQLKVLKNQLQEVGVWLGNVFVGTLGRILPYVNGFVMAIKELIKMFAIFVGYKSEGTGLDDILQVDTAVDGTGAVANNIDSASKKAKELKKTLMGFDVLNVIQTPTNTSASGGTGGGGGGVAGIDPKILGALQDYDSLMGDVSMKATKIRNRIMEWLGFTKLTDEAGNLLGWKLNDGYTNLEKIRNVLVLIAGVLAIISGLKIIGWLKTVFDLVKGVTIGGTALQKGLSVVTKAFEGLASVLGISAGALGAIVVALTVVAVGTYLAVQNFDKLKEAFLNLSPVGKILAVILTYITPITSSIAGLTLLIKRNTIYNGTWMEWCMGKS